MKVEALDPASYEAAISELAALLVDAVDGGASINFLAGATPEQTAGWWRARIDGVRSGLITLFVARDDDRIIGTTLIRVIDNGLVLSAVDANWFKFAIGVLTIFAVVANAWMRRRARSIKMEA